MSDGGGGARDTSRARAKIDATAETARVTRWSEIDTAAPPDTDTIGREFEWEVETDNPLEEQLLLQPDIGLDRDGVADTLRSGGRPGLPGFEPGGSGREGLEDELLGGRGKGMPAGPSREGPSFLGDDRASMLMAGEGPAPGTDEHFELLNEIRGGNGKDSLTREEYDAIYNEKPSGSDTDQGWAGGGSGDTGSSWFLDLMGISPEVQAKMADENAQSIADMVSTEMDNGVTAAEIFPDETEENESAADEIQKAMHEDYADGDGHGDEDDKDEDEDDSGEDAGGEVVDGETDEKGYTPAGDESTGIVVTTPLATLNPNKTPSDPEFDGPSWNADGPLVDTTGGGYTDPLPDDSAGTITLDRTPLPLLDPAKQPVNPEWGGGIDTGDGGGFVVPPQGDDFSAGGSDFAASGDDFTFAGGDAAGADDFDG